MSTRDPNKPVSRGARPQGRPGIEPVERFLGPGVGRGGPFGLLGLPVQRVTEPEVLRAVHDAMARIDAHPEARTPAANEARLAVHAAAANLLDKAVLEELLSRLGGAERTDQRLPSEARPSSVVPRASASLITLEADLLRCIAADGGWGEHAMRRFVKVACAKGHTVEDAVDAIGMVTGSQLSHRHIPSGRAERTVVAPTIGGGADRAAPDQSVAAASQDHPERQEPIEPGGVQSEPAPDRAGGLSAIGATTLVVAVFALMGVGAWVVLGSKESPEPAPVRPSLPMETARVTEQVREPDPDPVDVAENPPRALDNGPAIVHELTVATEGLGVDTAAAMADFASALDAISGRWIDLSLADRLAAQDLIIGFLYRVSGQSSLTTLALDAIEGDRGELGGSGSVLDPESLKRRVWSVGTMVRLRREQNLPSAVIRRIDRSILRDADGLGPNATTFRAGAVAALSAEAARIVGSDGSSSGDAPQATGDAWLAWSEAAKAATLDDTALLDSAVIAALERVLRGSGSGEYSSSSEATGVLCETLVWRAGGAARAWMLRAFSDRSLDVDDLHELTLAIATRSRADGIDPSMVLPRGASEFDRRALGERYREAWGMQAGADQDQAIASLLTTAADALREAPLTDGRDEVEVMSAVVRTARLNTAASLLWRAEFAEATDLLSSIDGPIDAVVESAGIPDVSGLFSAGSGTWAESYIEAGSHIPRRLSLLNALVARKSGLEPMEAEVVTVEAIRGSPQRVRDAAAAVVEASASDPVVVNALLGVLPTLPRTGRNARLIEIATGVTLPPPTDEGFRFAARKALVERLLELVAGHGIYARLDALQGLLSETYSVRLSGPTSQGVSGARPVPLPVERSARGLVERWAASAGTLAPSGLPRLGIDEIERRRSARLSMASGPVQLFHAEQLALLEVIASVVGSEQPDRIESIGAELEEVSRARAASASVLLQIEQAERAMLRLWVWRFGEVRG